MVNKCRNDAARVRQPGIYRRVISATRTPRQSSTVRYKERVTATGWLSKVHDGHEEAYGEMQNPVVDIQVEVV